MIVLGVRCVRGWVHDRWGLPALSRWSGENRLACSIARHVMCRLPSGTRATLVALHPHQPLPPGRFESSREI